MDAERATALRHGLGRGRRALDVNRPGGRELSGPGAVRIPNRGLYGSSEFGPCFV
jgi:hypothetical protein